PSLTAQCPLAPPVTRYHARASRSNHPAPAESPGSRDLISEYAGDLELPVHGGQWLELSHRPWKRRQGVRHESRRQSPHDGWHDTKPVLARVPALLQRGSDRDPARATRLPRGGGPGDPGGPEAGQSHALRARGAGGVRDRDELGGTTHRSAFGGDARDEPVQRDAQPRR